MVLLWDGAAFLLMAVGNAPFGEVVGRHLHSDAVTCQNSNAVTSEFAREVGQDRTILIQLNAKQSGGEFFNHGPGHFNAIFFTHSPPEIGMRVV